VFLFDSWNSYPSAFDTYDWNPDFGPLIFGGREEWLLNSSDGQNPEEECIALVLTWILSLESCVSCLVTWHVCGLRWIVWRLDVKGS
jgi:hypothetical protein